MYIRKQGGYQLWGSVHPSAVGCSAEGRPPCDHNFHIVDDAFTKCLDFDTFEEAQATFMELTGTEKMTIGSLIS